MATIDGMLRCVVTFGMVAAVVDHGIVSCEVEVVVVVIT